MAYATLKQKRGATFRLVLDQFDGDTWANINGAQVIEADVSQKAGRFSTTVVVDAVSQSILITANTSTWALGPAELDILIVKDGNRIIIPADGVIKINVLKTVTVEGAN